MEQFILRATRGAIVFAVRVHAAAIEFGHRLHDRRVQKAIGHSDTMRVAVYAAQDGLRRAGQIESQAQHARINFRMAASEELAQYGR